MTTPNELQLRDALKKSSNKSELTTHLGYSKDTNSRTYQKIKSWYINIGIDLVQELHTITLKEKPCVNCGVIIKYSPQNKQQVRQTTCSHSCSNTVFRSGNNNGMHNKAIKGGNVGSAFYRTLCFNHHEKKCIVCGECKIVEVHHNDHNHFNNDIENLIPLCPNHHRYIHSRYRVEVQPIIDEYVEGRRISNSSINLHHSNTTTP